MDYDRELSRAYNLPLADPKPRRDEKSLAGFIKGGRMERIIQKIAPSYALKRARSRYGLAMGAMAAGYDGATFSKPSLRHWRPNMYDADSIIQFDLQYLRDRSRDLERNNPLALGAINTKCTSVVGTGLRLHARIDRSALNMDDDKAEELEGTIEREWRLWYNSVECDAARTLNGYGIQKQVYRRYLVDGDSIVLMADIKRDGSPYGLKQKVIEGDRLTNPNWSTNLEGRHVGVELDANGAPVQYHIMNRYPWQVGVNLSDLEWIPVPAYGKNGRRNVLHIYKPERPGQYRGVPNLAPVIEILKQLGRFTSAEVDAAVINSYFTVFFTSDLGGEESFTSIMGGKEKTTTPESNYDVEMGPGMVHMAPPGMEPKFADPKRPNANFGAFVESLLQFIGVALELPYEILVKHFTSSYSASQAALLEAWRFFKAERKWFIQCYLQPLYENWFMEAVAMGRISAPGFFRDPIVRQAYLGTRWMGDPRGMIDEVKQIAAANLRNVMGMTTLEDETAEMFGEEWEKIIPQLKREMQIRQDIGLMPVMTRVPDSAKQADEGASQEGQPQKKAPPADTGEGEGEDALAGFVGSLARTTLMSELQKALKD